GEGVDAGLHQRDQLGAGLEADVVGVEDLPVGGLDLALGVGWDLGQQVAGSVEQTALAQRAAEAGLGGVDQAAGAIGDDQQRRAQPRPLSSSRKSLQASVDSLPPGASPRNTGLPSGGKAHPTSPGSARAPGCSSQQEPSRNRQSNSTWSRRRADQRSNSSVIASPTRLTVDLLTPASAPRASARVASTSRTDRPRTNPAITNDSKAFVLVPPAPKSRDAKR